MHVPVGMLSRSSVNLSIEERTRVSCSDVRSVAMLRQGQGSTINIRNFVHHSSRAHV